jgi:hypothetical protein
MGLVRSLEIESYRGFQGVRFEGFGDVNLIVGPNNAGKSSVIEAVGLVCRPIDPGQWVQTAVHRDMSASLVDSLWGMFPGAQALTFDHGTETSPALAIRAGLSVGEREMRCTAHASTWARAGQPGEGAGVEARVTVSVRVTCAGGDARRDMDFVSSPSMRAPVTGAGDVPLLRVLMVTPFTHRSTQQMVSHLSDVIDKGKKANAVEILRLFEPEVKDVDISRPLGQDAIRIVHAGRGVVDLSSFGDGMRRAFALALALMRAEGGAVLVDELEEGVHPAALPELVSWFVSTARQVNAQVIATTHSLETVDAVLSATRDTSPDPVVAHHLRRAGGGIEVRRLPGEDMRFLRDERALDIR